MCYSNGPPLTAENCQIFGKLQMLTALRWDSTSDSATLHFRCGNAGGTESDVLFQRIAEDWVTYAEIGSSVLDESVWMKRRWMKRRWMRRRLDEAWLGEASLDEAMFGYCAIGRSVG